MDISNTLYVFTDGSVNKRTKMCASAYVISYRFHPITIDVVKSEGTSQLGEVVAMHSAIKKINEMISLKIIDGRNVVFVSDSQYVVKSINEYSNNWKKNGYENTWVGANKKPISHEKLFKEMIMIKDSDGFKGFKFMHINSHLNNENEIVRAREKFELFNEVIVSRQVFNNFVQMNEVVDKLAYDEIN